MRLADPLYLLLFIPLAWFILRRHRFLKDAPSFKYSDTALFGKLKPSFRVRYSWLPYALRMVIFSLLIIALARPQFGKKEEEVITEGVGIVMTLDISSSMRAEDFKPQNRLGAAKEVIKDFVDMRKHDRIGMVVFSRYAVTQCPLTLDYGIIKKLVDEIDIGMIEDGTAIGTALAVSVNRLKDSKAKSKVIILLTDGVNNAGEIDPVTAAKVAATFGIKVYTIGAGKPGTALYPVMHPIFGKQYVRMKTEIDEKTLDEISRITGGMYFRAKDADGLKDIYKQIDKLEKTEIQVKEYTEYNELCNFFMIPAFMFLLLEIILSGTVFRKIP